MPELLDRTPTDARHATALPASIRVSPHSSNDSYDVAALVAYLNDARIDSADPAALGAQLTRLVDAGFDRLPLPGHGHTLIRWRALAAVAARDLGLVKLFEGHTDALAILAELGGPVSHAHGTWAVWAAEAPDARLCAMPGASPDEGKAALQLNGVKAWCSGAQSVNNALVTAWNGDRPILAAMQMDQPSIRIDASAWQAVGMRATASADVHVDSARAVQVGTPGAYLERPGFWHGGGGIAACWYGAAAQIAALCKASAVRRGDPHKFAHVGAIDVALSAARALLVETARLIDDDPHTAHRDAVMRVRLAVEEAATQVLSHAGRALGAAPLCRDARFARLAADLPVFLRQSHAERDLAALGESVAYEAEPSWAL